MRAFIIALALFFTFPAAARVDMPSPKDIESKLAAAKFAKRPAIFAVMPREVDKFLTATEEWLLNFPADQCVFYTRDDRFVELCPAFLYGKGSLEFTFLAKQGDTDLYLKEVRFNDKLLDTQQYEAFVENRRLYGSFQSPADQRVQISIALKGKMIPFVQSQTFFSVMNEVGYTCNVLTQTSDSFTMFCSLVEAEENSPKLQPYMFSFKIIGDQWVMESATYKRKGTFVELTEFRLWELLKKLGDKRRADR
jgi:hypothetical protein